MERMTTVFAVTLMLLVAGLIVSFKVIGVYRDRVKSLEKHIEYLKETYNRRNN